MADEADVCSKISESVKIAGFLDKKGSMLWKRYWFVLEDRLLLYYRSQLEYLNLSPCRGSVNMSLVSSVQPRRNSRDPVIHIVSRSNTLILKAYDRDTQTKWLQSLLESMGKGLSPHQHLSCENLPSQLNSLPRSRHTGSLDVVWRKQLTPTCGPVIDKTDDQSTSTAPDSRNSTLGRIKTALSRRSSSDPDTRIPKRHRESFLRKIIGKSKSKNEVSGVMEPESDEDPFYDTIGANPQNTLKELLPGATLDELKVRLAEKEKGKLADPPELPPRIPFGSNTWMNEEDIEESEESDLSGHYQVIRKTQPTTTKTEEVPQARVLTAEEKMEIYAMYSIPKSKSNDSCGTAEFLTPSASKELAKDSNHNLIEKAENNIKDALCQVRTKEGIEMLIKELKEIENRRLGDEVKTTVSLPEVVQKVDKSQVTTLLYGNNQGLSEPLVIEIRHYPDEVVPVYEQSEYEGVTAFREDPDVDENEKTEVSEIKIEPTDDTEVNPVEETKDLPEEVTQEIKGDTIDAGLVAVKHNYQEVVRTISEQNERAQVNNTQENSEDIATETTDNVTELEESTLNSLDVAVDGNIETDYEQMVEVKDVAKETELLFQVKQVADSLSKKEITPRMHRKTMWDVAEEMTDLNSLLKQLTELTTAPLLAIERVVENSSKNDTAEDPDYDIPRPHSAVVSRISEDLDRLPATEFFTKVEDDASSSGQESVEPDSLEAKKEVIAMCSQEN